MSDVRPQYYPEKPQQELRFTARDPLLDEALALLEKEGERHSTYLPKNLFLFAMKRISIDLSDTFDGTSQNYSTFLQYRQALDNISSRGRKQFKLASWMRPLRAGGPNGDIRGVGLRVLIDPLYSDKIIKPPLYGPDHHRAPLSTEQRAQDSAAYETLRKARTAGYIPIRYEIGNIVDDPTEPLERLGEVLELGAFVSQMTIVPSYPRSAREADIFHEEKIERTYTRIDELLESQLIPPDNVIPIRKGDNPTFRSAG